MKTRLPHILILTCIAFAAFAGAAYGQDTGLPDYEITDHERDKILNSPGEGETRYKVPISTSVAKDSAALMRSMPAAPVALPTRTKEQAVKPEKQSPPPPKQDDDSILSFNFLYYIIQKYKLQDIID